MGDDFVFQERFVDFLRDGFRVCNPAREESFLAEITWVWGPELVGKQVVSLRGSEVYIVYGVICEVREGIGDQAAERELSILGCHIR